MNSLSLFFRLTLAAFVLLTLYLIALPSELAELRSESAGWAVTPAVLLANIAAFAACLLALVLTMRLWPNSSARWLSVFLALSAFAWGLATAPTIVANNLWPPLAERLRFPVVSASIPMALTALVMFAIYFPVPLRREDFRYWHARAEKETPGGRFGNFLSLSPARPGEIAISDEMVTRDKRLSYLDYLSGEGWNSRRIEMIANLESLAVKPNQVATMGLAVAAFVFLVSLVFSRGFFSSYAEFSFLGLAFFFLRVSYSVRIELDRRKLLWVAEGLTLSFVIPFLFTLLSFPLLALVSSLFEWPLGQLVGVYPIGWAGGWIVLIVCLAIATFKEGVLDPKLVIKKTVFYSALTGIVVLLYLGLAGGAGTVLMRMTGITNQSVTIASTLALAVVFMPVRTRVQGFVERRLFRKEKEQSARLDSIMHEASGNDELNEALARIADHLRKGLDKCDVLIFSRFAQNHPFGLIGGSSVVYFSQSSAVVNSLTEPKSVGDLELPDDDKERLRMIRSVLLIPARHGSDLLGFLSVGDVSRGRRFDAQDIQFLESAARHIATMINSHLLKSEQQDVKQAREIQERLLPVSFPHIAGFDVFGASAPARHVGGDYFDVLKLSDSRTLVCIADVAGKGMPAALLMSNIQATVKTLAEDGVSPKRLCERANRLISDSIAPGKFITFFLGILDSSTFRFIYVNAGHNPPILFRERDGEELLEAGGPVLGVLKDIEYEQAEVKLFRGDQVLLYTDGVTEAANAQGEEFGEENLIRLVRRVRASTAHSLQEAVMTGVSEFCHGNFHDDVTVVAIQVIGDAIS